MASSKPVQNDGFTVGPDQHGGGRQALLREHLAGVPGGEGEEVEEQEVE